VSFSLSSPIPIPLQSLIATAATVNPQVYPVIKLVAVKTTKEVDSRQLYYLPRFISDGSSNSSISEGASKKKSKNSSSSSSSLSKSKGGSSKKSKKNAALVSSSSSSQLAPLLLGNGHPSQKTSLLLGTLHWNLQLYLYGHPHHYPVVHL